MPVVFEYQPRTYRDYTETGRFHTFRVTVETSDLYVKALARLEHETEELIKECRSQIQAAISRRPLFLTSLEPIPVDPRDGPVPIRMIKAAAKAGTGPMAAVAGAVAEFVGRRLTERSPEVIIENGGDIFAHLHTCFVCGLYAGRSPFSNKLGFKIDPKGLPVGVCTSSGTVGPSRSFGKADAAVVISHDTTLADAVATALGNRIQGFTDLRKGVEWAMKIEGVRGAVAVLRDKMAVLGDIELIPLTHTDQDIS